LLLAAATAFEPSPGASAFDQDAAHGLSGRREKVTAAVPVLGLVLAHQTQVGLVNERRGLERLPGLLLGQALAANWRSST
jgi:hypothetical protein